MRAVGIPREIKVLEKRVGLTPEGVRALVRAGIPVRVETRAGEGSGFPDSDYLKAGARIDASPRELYEACGVIQKIKEPLAPEWPFFRPGLILVSFLHLASPSNGPLLQQLLKRKVTGIAFETVFKEGRAIFLEPMSRIAGTLSAYYAGFLLQFVKVKSGKILYPPKWIEKLEALAAIYPGIPDGLRKVHAGIVGGGVVGSHAAGIILRMGGEVDLVEKNPLRRTALQKLFESHGERFRVWSPEEDFRKPFRAAEAWIGSVHVLGARAPQVLTGQDLAELSREKKKLIIDVSVDQGGNFPGTRPTTYENPLYLDSEGNLRFAVVNIPSLCGRGASEALEKATLPYVSAMALDFKEALRNYAELRIGIQTWEGKLVNAAVAGAHEIPWQDLFFDR